MNCQFCNKDVANHEMYDTSAAHQINKEYYYICLYKDDIVNSTVRLWINEKEEVIQKEVNFNNGYLIIFNCMKKYGEILLPKKRDNMIIHHTAVPCPIKWKDLSPQNLKSKMGTYLLLL